LDAELSAPNVVSLTTGVQDPGAAETVTAFQSRSAAGVNGAADQFANFRAGITTLRRINEVPSPGTNDASPLLGEIVTVQGTVTALDGSYYYLQDDDGGAWDAIYSRVAKDGPLAVGDLVRVAGRVNEFFEATQINFQAGVNFFVNLGTSPNPPVVTDRTAAQIKYAHANKIAEPWENNLVRLTPATVIDSCVVSAGEDCAGRGSPSFGEYELVQAADTAAVDFGTFEQVYYEPCTGDQLAVTGVLRYDFGAYRVTTRNGDDLEVIDGCNVAGVPESGPKVALVIDQNSPNPFTAQTKIQLRLPQDTRIDIEVLDVAGRLVTSLAAGDFPAGQHVLAWDGTSANGVRVAAGTYFYRVRANGVETSRKMMLVR
jgi:hypothetical protein